jgi:hypothetical protein
MLINIANGALAFFMKEVRSEYPRVSMRVLIGLDSSNSNTLLHKHCKCYLNSFCEIRSRGTLWRFCLCARIAQSWRSECSVSNQNRQSTNLWTPKGIWDNFKDDQNQALRTKFKAELKAMFLLHCRKEDLRFTFRKDSRWTESKTMIA